MPASPLSRSCRSTTTRSASTGFTPHDDTPALEQVAPTIETPVLVLHGEHDTFVGIGNSRRVADALSNSEFHVIADAGHYSWEDNSEPDLAHVLDWIERAEAAIDT